MRETLILLICICLVSSATFCSNADDQSEAQDAGKFERQRRDMVEHQIEARGVSDKRVLKAMLSVKRHLFVPREHWRAAYADYPLPIGEDQTISQPYIVALMTELLELDGPEKVLEIGTGSGYQAAILAELADSVFSIEIIPDLAQGAETLLKELGYQNIVVRCGDGYAGWEEHAPFDAVIVTCAPPEIPQPLLDQLADGGRMVIPVGTLWQELLLVTKIDDRVKKEKVIPVRFVPMTGEALEKE